MSSTGKIIVDIYDDGYDKDPTETDVEVNITNPNLDVEVGNEIEIEEDAFGDKYLKSVDSGSFYLARLTGAGVSGDNSYTATEITYDSLDDEYIDKEDGLVWDDSIGGSGNRSDVFDVAGRANLEPADEELVPVRIWRRTDSEGNERWVFQMLAELPEGTDQYKVLQVDADGRWMADYVRAH